MTATLKDVINNETIKRTMSALVGTKRGDEVIALPEALVNALRMQGINHSQYNIAVEGLAWIDVLLRKNLDYGDSVFKVGDFSPDVPADAAIRVRMGDKTSRIRSLLASGKNLVDESVEDTIRDLGAYCLLLLVGRKLETSVSDQQFLESVAAQEKRVADPNPQQTDHVKQVITNFITNFTQWYELGYRSMGRVPNSKEVASYLSTNL